ncbi:MAG: glucosyltransferase domain-containing protein [Christensenellaceae bacterium]
MNLDMNLKNLFSRVTPVTKTTFFSGIIAGLITHIYYFTNAFANEDFSTLYRGNYTATHVGRWLVGPFVDTLWGYSLPALIGVMVVLVLACTSMIVVNLFKIESKICAIVVTMAIVTFPSIAYYSGYYILHYVYIISMLFSAAAVLVSVKYKYGWIPGSMLLCAALALYQAYLAFAVSLCIMFLIMEIVRGECDTIAIFKKARDLLLMGIGGGFLYLISVKISLMLTGTQMSAYAGSDTMGQIPLDQLPQLLKKAYGNFLYFFSGEQFFFSNNILKTAYAIILLAIGLLTIYLVFKKKLYARIEFCFLVVLFGVLPIGINILDIVAPELGTRCTNSFQYVLVFVLSVVLSQTVAQTVCTNKLEIKVKQWQTPLILITVAIVAWNYCVMTNTYYLKLNVFYERTYAFCNRVIARVEQMPQFSSKSKVLYFGDLPNQNYLNGFMFPEIRNEAGLWGQYIGTQKNTKHDYKIRNFLDFHLGIATSLASEEERKQIQNSDELLNMDIWPAEDSVKVVNDLIVVKFNHLYNLAFTKKNSETYQIFPQSSDPVLKEECQYAWYIDAPDGSREFVQWYTPDRVLEYTFLQKGKYRIVMFIQTKDGKALASNYDYLLVE